MRQRFTAPLKSAGGGGHFVEVPAKVAAPLSGKGRTPVVARFNGAPYRGSVTKMRGVTMIGVPKAVMAETGAEAGDKVEVVVELDEQPRVVELPNDLRKALSRRKGLLEALSSFAHSHQREYVQWIEEAKKEETRARRITRAVEMIAKRKKFRD
ncbi:MAG: YdeI/OmpD-associated family protein [Actinomycetota bacterium]